MESGHEQIMLMLGEIRGDVKGIHQRLDISNGRLSKHDVSLNELKSYQDRQIGQTKLLSVVWGAASAICVSLITFLITRRI